MENIQTDGFDRGINESSEVLARTLLTQLVVDAKLKLICTPARSIGDSIP